MRREPPRWASCMADPNPFTSSTTIRYDVPREAFVTLTVYDMAGRKVATLVSALQQAGAHQAHLDGRNLASGVYLYRLEANGRVSQGRMTLVR